MEILCLAIQIIFLLGTFFLPTNDRYLVDSDSYKKYLLVGSFIQTLCIAVNVVMIFVSKEIMIYVSAIHIIVASTILVVFSRKAKKEYYKKLTNAILENDLLSSDAKKIKDFLLEKYEKLYFVEDIEKCISTLKK